MFSSLQTAARCSATTLRRTFAASANQQHRPVITLHGLHARYANATYMAASKTNQLELVESELNGLAAAATTSAKFRQFLENPLISRDDKTQLVVQMSDQKFTNITRNLLVTMAGNARLSELPKVASTYHQLLKAKRGQVDAKIISAQPLTAAQLKDIERAMMQSSQVVSQGQTVVIQAVTDPSIVGGLQVQIGDQFLDLSVKGRIEEIAGMSLD